MANYLVTGAAGFIASKVTELLLDAGHTVAGVDNMNDAYDVRLKDWRLKQIVDREGFSFHRIDICDRDALEAVFDSHGPFDAVVNLAARAGVRQSVENPWVYVDTNTTGTLNLLELCKDKGVKKFSLASTSSLYGAHNTMPYAETADTSRPLSPYAASKKGAEALCYTYHYLYGIDVTVHRYFTVYGPSGRPDMSLFRFCQWIHEEKPLLIYGDGKQSRDFTYVDDIARGTILGLKDLGFETINLGSDTPTILMDVVKYIEEKIGTPAKLVYEPRHPADVTETWANIDKARSMLGWEPQTTWQQGVDNLIAWYRENRDWASQVVT
ncbi:MAG: NAD-dependent epimerase/dehydratase family protein [Planctomycetota bacterium]|jgi:nucleoside-diphosphate-sugar epimerase